MQMISTGREFFATTASNRNKPCLIRNNSLGVENESHTFAKTYLKTKKHEENRISNGCQ